MHQVVRFLGVISQWSVSAMNTWNGWRNASLQGERSDVFTASAKMNDLMQRLPEV
jgi:hypothetical protein